MITVRNRARALLAACAALTLAVTLSGCGADSSGVSDAPKEKRSFAFSGGELTIVAGNADLRVEPADVQRVEVTRQVAGWVFLGSGPRASWRMDGDTLRLGVRCTALASDCTARHAVLVPRGVAVKVDSDNGRVRATGFTTALSLRTGNGRTDLDNVSGPLQLRSDNGEVRAEGVTSKRVTARSGNGRIDLVFASAPDRLDATTDNGALDVRLPTAHTAYAVDAKTGNGSVDIDVPRDPAGGHARSCAPATAASRCGPRTDPPGHRKGRTRRRWAGPPTVYPVRHVN